MPDPELKTISASEMPAVLGVVPNWQTRWLVAQRFLGREVPRPGDNRMDWGKRMQKDIIEVAGAEFAIEIEPNSFDLYMRRGKLGCTVDAWSTIPDQGKGAIECKCVFDYGTWMREWAGGRTPPKYVEVQLQQQLYVGDGNNPFKWGMIVAWVAGELHAFRREPIPELWAQMERAAEEFFADIAAGDPGEAIGLPCELPLLNALFAPIPGKVLDLRADPRGEHYAGVVQQLDYHQTEASGHERGAKAHRAELGAIMEDCQELLLPSGIRVKATRVNRKGHTVGPSSYNKISTYIPEPGAPAEQPADTATILAGG